MKIYYPLDFNHDDVDHHYSFVFFSSSSDSQHKTVAQIMQVTPANQLNPIESGTLTPEEPYQDNKTPQMMNQSGSTEAHYTD